MNITEANAVCILIRALAGDERHDSDAAAKALGLLHDKAYQALSAGPDAATLAAAHHALVGRVPTVELVDDGESAALMELLGRVYDELDLADPDMAEVMSHDLERDIARTVELARERNRQPGPGLFDQVDEAVTVDG